ncbi:MAG: rubrerythrin family protein [Nitrososphaerota archaeon]|jgi:VIT1/CCC1 family predicted Fe2+/Mn2+ transporter|nr:rubrerythrin family protein [Nitrososphaerota archaeon]MDG6903935.1 rubrerythrin family protein [Nitrososphaerota archaeon]MDG6912708.1 rubrerythrin family protein [Nitrososphaerota archaeon]MDG6919152.1 rubrerythrin family protein [Nitrososphaerota archaeon]MDG6921336.1 rubrerythrin family protein [Nitrososphaerota archaeon]
MPPGDEALKGVARTRMSDEWSDYTLYERLSKTVNQGSAFAEVLKALSVTEHRHYEFWKKYVPGEEPRLAKLKLYWVLFLRRFLGLTFATRYLDRHEENVVQTYKGFAALIPEEDRAAFDEMVADEKDHEKALEMKVESSAVRYISFIVLGLADSLVEISGIHAGSLGFYDQTEIAGLAGVIAGAAASLAMASAAYAQAKQGGFEGSARLSAIYTGVSYFLTAITLATPYFLTKNMILALSSSLSLAVAILAITTWYSVVIQHKTFLRDFLEILLILFGATIALYFFGYVVHGVFPGIRVS